jgi:hypothetical protein
VVRGGQGFPCKTVDVYLLRTREERYVQIGVYNLALHPASWVGTIYNNNNASLVSLYCVEEHRNGPPPDEAFYSEVNHRHGLSTAWVPCIHSAWFGSVALSLFALCPIRCIIHRFFIVSYSMLEFSIYTGTFSYNSLCSFFDKMNKSTVPFYLLQNSLYLFSL